MSTSWARIVSVSLSLALIILLPALTVLPTRVAGRVGSGNNPTNLAVDNPVPTLSTISPANTLAGGAAFTLTATGANFDSSSIVRFNGNDRTTTFLSASQLTAQITAADIQAGGTFPITVFNPAPGGGASNAIYLTVIIEEPFPVLSSISPASKVAGDAAFTLTVSGAAFRSNSVVRWNAQDRATTFVSSTQLTAQITAADIATAGTANVSVFNPLPGGGISNALSFTVIALLVDVFRIFPTFKIAGSPAFMLTVTGANLNSSLVVRFNGSDRPTTLISATQLIAQIAAADVAVAGTYPITVFNPAGGTSPAFNFTVVNPSSEADVAPRPNGSNDGRVSIADWVQAGRFAAGLDTAVAGSEFQAADCAPRETLGDGIISIADWVQAGRYASGLDPVTAAGGPTGPTGSSSPSTAHFHGKPSGSPKEALGRISSHN